MSASETPPPLPAEEKSAPRLHEDGVKGVAFRSVLFARDVAIAFGAPPCAFACRETVLTRTESAAVTVPGCCSWAGSGGIQIWQEERRRERRAPSLAHSRRVSKGSRSVTKRKKKLVGRKNHNERRRKKSRSLRGTLFALLVFFFFSSSRVELPETEKNSFLI